MKLLTHNFMSSRFLKGVNEGYPLRLHVTKMENRDVEFNAEFVKNIMSKCDYGALRTACESINEASKLPANLPDDLSEHDDILRELHRVLFCIEVIEGELECPDTGRRFPIHDSIPNLLVEDNE
ncbi:unnamed protein product [Caenorhabditis auriculariae]|uniref:Multifunctional methyltransferase subunit TRM112-like protein n=1 Tax=Caenorhabditis auriculariae TaxID=2777116 RepID=A0A8S1HCX5_9PELO|nr:unnamed protein product [Caenorhabditis auriculariae]